MKPDINPTPCLNVRILTPRLAQPEEIDHILMALAAQKAAGVSYGVVHRKHPLRLPDHYQLAPGPDENPLTLIV